MNENKSFKDLSQENDKQLFEISKKIKNQQHTLISEISDSINNAKNNTQIKRIINNNIKNKMSNDIAANQGDISINTIKNNDIYNIKNYRYEIMKKNSESGTKINAWDIKDNFITRELLNGGPGNYSSSILDANTISKINDITKMTVEQEADINLEIIELNKKLKQQEEKLAKKELVLSKAIKDTNSVEFKEIKDKYLKNISDEIISTNEEIKSMSNKIDEYDKILLNKKNKIAKQEAIIKNNITELEKKKTYIKDPIKLKEINQEIKAEKEKLNNIKTDYLKNEIAKNNHSKKKIELEKKLKELKVKNKTEESLKNNIKENIQNDLKEIEIKKKNLKSFANEQIKQNFENDINTISSDAASNMNKIDFKFKTFDTKEDLEKALEHIENNDAKNIVRNLYSLDKKSGKYIKQEYILWNSNEMSQRKGIIDIVDGDVSKIKANFKEIDIEAIKEEYYQEKSKMIKEVQEMNKSKEILDRFKLQNNNNSKEIINSVKKYLIKNDLTNEELENKIINSANKGQKISSDEYTLSLKKLLSNKNISDNVSIIEVENAMKDFDSISNTLNLLKSDNPMDILKGKNSIRESWTDKTAIGTNKIKAQLYKQKTNVNQRMTSSYLLDNHSLPEIISFVEQAVSDTEKDIMNKMKSLNIDISKNIKKVSDIAFESDRFSDIEEDRSLNVEEDRIIASEYDTGTAHKRDSNNIQYVKENKEKRNRDFYEESNKVTDEIDSNIQTNLLQKEFVESNKGRSFSKIRNRVVEITNANIKNTGRAIRIEDLKRNLTLEELEKGYVTINDQILPIKHTQQFNTLMSINDLRNTEIPFKDEEWLTGKLKIGDNNYDISQFEEYYDNNFRKQQIENANKFIEKKYEKVLLNKNNEKEAINDIFNNRLQNMLPQLTRTVKQTKRKRIYSEEKNKIVHKNYTIDRKVPLFTDNYPEIAQSKISEKMFKSIEPSNPLAMRLTTNNGEKKIVEATIENINSLAKEYNVKLPDEINSLLKEYGESIKEIKNVKANSIEEKLKEINLTNKSDFNLKSVELTTNDEISYNKYITNEKYSPILYTEKDIDNEVLKKIEKVQQTPNKLSLKFKNDTISYDIDKIEDGFITAKPTAWINPSDLTMDINIQNIEDIKNLKDIDSYKDAMSNISTEANKNLKTQKYIGGKTYDSKTLFNEFLNDRRYTKYNLNNLTTTSKGKKVPIGLNLKKNTSFNMLGFDIISTSFPWMINGEDSIHTLASSSEIAVREAFLETSSGEFNKQLIENGITDISVDKAATAMAFEDAIAEKVKVKILKQYMEDANKNNKFFLIDVAKKAINDKNEEVTVENIQSFFNSILPYVKQDKSLKKRFGNLQSIANNKKSITELLQAYKNSDIKSFDKIFDSVEEGLENNLGFDKLKTLTSIHGITNSNSEKDILKIDKLITNVKINKSREKILKELGTNDEVFRRDIINSVAKKYTNQKIDINKMKNLSKEEVKAKKNKEFLKIRKNIEKSNIPIKDLYSQVSNKFLINKDDEINKILNLKNFSRDTFNKLEPNKQVELLHNILETETKQNVSKMSTISSIKDILNGKTDYMNNKYQKFYMNNKDNMHTLISQFVESKGGIQEIASLNEIQKLLKNSKVSDYESFKDYALISDLSGIDIKFKGKDSQGNKVEFDASDIKKGYDDTPGNIITNKINNENLPIANNIEEVTRKEKLNLINSENIYTQKKNNILSYDSTSSLFINKNNKVTSILSDFPSNYDKVSELPGNSIGTFNPGDTLINTENFRQAALKDDANAVTIDYETTGLKEDLNDKLFSPVELSIQHVKATETQGKINIDPQNTRSIFLSPNEDIMSHITPLLEKDKNNMNNLKKGLEDNSTDINMLKNYAKYDYADAIAPIKIDDNYIFFKRDHGWEHSNMTPNEYISKIQDSAKKVMEFLNNPTKAEPITTKIDSKDIYKNIASFMDSAQKEVKKNNPDGYVIAHNFSGAENPWTKDFTDKAIEFIDNSNKKKYTNMKKNIEENGLKKPIDTMQLIKTTEPGRISNSLEFLAKDKNIKNNGTSHLASVDVTNTTSLLENILNTQEYKNISDAINNPIKKGDLIFKKRHDNKSMSLEKGVYKIADIDNGKENGVILTLQQMSNHSDKKTIQIEAPNKSTLQREANKNWSIINNNNLEKALEIDDKIAHIDAIRTLNTSMKNYDILTLYKTRALENGNKEIKNRLSKMKEHYDSATKKISYQPSVNENGIKEFTTQQLTDKEKIALGNAHILSDAGYAKEIAILNRIPSSKRMLEMKKINKYMNSEEGKLIDKYLFEGHVRKESKLISDAQYHDYINNVQQTIKDFKKNNGETSTIIIPDNFKIGTINSQNISTVAEASDKLSKIKPIEFNIDMTSKNSIENSIWDVANKIGKEMEKNGVVYSANEGKSLALKKHVLPLLQKQGIIPNNDKWLNISNKASNLSSSPIPNIQIESKYENMLPEVSTYLLNNKENLLKENKIRPLEIVDMLKPSKKESLHFLDQNLKGILNEVDNNIITPNGTDTPIKDFDKTINKIIDNSKRSIQNTESLMGGPIPFAKTDFETEKMLKENSIKEFNIKNPVNDQFAFKSADEIINFADSLPKDKDIMSSKNFIKLYNNSETRDVAKQSMPEYVETLKKENGKTVDYISSMNKNIIENINNIESQLKNDYKENAQAKTSAYRELKNRASRKTLYDNDIKLLEEQDKTVFNARKVLGRIQEGDNGEYFTAPIASPSDITSIKNKTKLDPSKIKITSGADISNHRWGDLTGYSLTDLNIPELKELLNNKHTVEYDKKMINQYLSIPNIESVHTKDFALNNLFNSKAEKTKLQFGDYTKSFDTIVEKMRNSMDNNNIIDEMNKETINKAEKLEIKEKTTSNIISKNNINNRINSPLGKSSNDIKDGIDDIIQRNVSSNRMGKSTSEKLESSVISDTIENVTKATKDISKNVKEVTSTILNSSAVKYGMLGLAFAGTAFMLNRRTSDGGRQENRPQKDSAPNVNGEYDKKQYNGQDHTKIPAPKRNVRIEENGGGMTINVSARNRGKANDQQVQNAIKDTINNSLTANVNIHQRDDRQSINSNFVSDLISKALGK